MSSEDKFFESPLFPLLLLFVLGGATVIFFGVRGVIWGKLSVDWPVAQGIVTSSSVGSSYNRESRSTSFEAKVEYEFTVEGVTFEGDRIFFGKWSSGNDSKEQEIAWHYPEGKSVNVYYNPGNPEVCLLEPGKTGKSWSLILFGALFLLVGIFFWVVFDLR